MLALSKADLVTAEGAREAVAEWQRRLGPEVAGDRHLERDGRRAGRAGERAAAAGCPFGHARGAPGGDRLVEALPAEAVSVGGRERSAGGRRPARSGAGEQELAEHMVFRPVAPDGFRVERLGPRSFAVRGRGIERLLARYDVENEDAMAFLEGRLRRIGVLKALEAEGFQPGDEIEISGVTFELDPGEAS